MTTAILEQQRRAHEEVERLEDLVVRDIINTSSSHHIHPTQSHSIDNQNQNDSGAVPKKRRYKDRLAHEHRITRYLEQIQEKSKFLLDSYEDSDGLRRAEINAISGATEFSEFYKRLKDIKDHHRRYPNEVVEPMELQFMRQEKKREEDGELDLLFSGEERLGRCLDLNRPFELFVNLKGITRINYQTYVGEFDSFDGISKETKASVEYKRYLDELYSYLVGFCTRSKPLYDWGSIEAETLAAVKESFEAEDEDREENALFCKACDKEFAKQSVYDGHLSGKKHKKAVESMGQQQSQEQSGGTREKRRQVLEKEVLIIRIAQDLDEVRKATRVYLDQKQTLSYDELKKYFDEEEEVEVALSESEDEDSEKIYNPLKLPLGWDGKPIPYWLYKLHGLGVEYPCEICGGFVYMGRKAFDRHFQEWRHAHGMKCLGIPNSKNFHEITKIEDAYALWEKLRHQAKVESFKADAMEEFEDAEGNVFNKKTFEDLKRQGLL